MTPKEKAKELIDKFESYEYDEGYGGYTLDRYRTKELALICVEQCIQCCAYHDHKTKQEHTETYNEPNNNFVTWWLEVKHEIENL